MWESATSKRLYVKTRTGGVRLLVRENYLRNDVTCQHARCSGCHDVRQPEGSGGEGAVVKALSEGSHVVIPTAAVLQFFLELIEECSAASSHREGTRHAAADEAAFAFSQVVLLQTAVAEAVQSRAARDLVGSTPGVGCWGHQASRRIGALLADLRKPVVYLRNENSLATYSPRQPGESLAVYSARLVNRAALWYASHLAGSASSVVLVDCPGIFPVSPAPEQAPAPAPSSPSSPPASGDSPPPSRFAVSFDKPVVLRRQRRHSVGAVASGDDGLAGVGSAESAASPRLLRMSLTEYMEWASGTPDHLKTLSQSLSDSVAALSRRQQTRGGADGSSCGVEAVMFKEYLGNDALEAGTASGAFLKGRLQVSENTPHEASVCDGDRGMDVFIPSKEHMNRAIDGDTVVVQLLPEAQWTAPSSILRYHRADGGVHKASAVSEHQQSQPKVPTGRVVGILEMNRRAYVATLQIDAAGASSSSSSQQGQSTVIAVPMDMRIPKVRITTRRAVELAEQRLVIRIDRWLTGSRYPEGHIVKEIGRIGTERSEVDAILVERDVAVEDFTPSMLSSLPNGSTWTPSPEELARRRDLRQSHLIMSIDPPGCTDIDDALSVRELDDGAVLEIGVHIADVSAFVFPDTLLDMEARSRATTVYLAHRRFDMLPEVLSANLCSLKEREDRYAMSVIWRLNASDYSVLDVWFGRTVIRSSFALAYQQAQKILDNEAQPSRLTAEHRPLVRPLSLLLKFTQHLQAARVANGALGLGSTEISFDLESIDKENAGGEFSLDVKSLSIKEDLPVNSMVAECMILANQAVAERIFKFFPTASLLRRHPPPIRRNTKELEELMSLRGFRLDSLSNKSFARFLEQSSQRDDVSIRSLIRLVATRALNEAKYISTGEFNVEDFAHYGLALGFYTHFTSPIRRYADLVVHRLLWQSIRHGQDGGQGPTTPTLPDLSLRTVCLHINQKNRSAKMASQDSRRFLLMMYLDQHPDNIYDAVIASVRSNGFVVQIPYLSLNGPVYLVDPEGQPLNIPHPFTSASILPAEHEVRFTSADGSVSRSLHRLDRVPVKITVSPSRFRHPRPICHLAGLDVDESKAIGLSGKMERHQMVSPPQPASSSAANDEEPVSAATTNSPMHSTAAATSIQQPRRGARGLERKQVNEFNKPTKNGRVSFRPNPKR